MQGGHSTREFGKTGKNSGIRKMLLKSGKYSGIVNGDSIIFLDPISWKRQEYSFVGFLFLSKLFWRWCSFWIRKYLEWSFKESRISERTVPQNLPFIEQVPKKEKYFDFKFWRRHNLRIPYSRLILLLKFRIIFSLNPDNMN